MGRSEKLCNKPSTISSFIHRTSRGQAFHLSSFPAAVSVLILLNSCGPSTQFQRVYPGTSLPRPEGATVETVTDPPGKPYQLLGIVSAGAQAEGLTGSSLETVRNSMRERAREEGADAIVLPATITQSQTTQYHNRENGSTWNETRTVNVGYAYAIRWEQPGDTISIPGKTTVASIVERWTKQYQASGRLPPGMEGYEQLGKSGGDKY